MAPYNPEIHHRRSIRLPRFDYTRAGAYFVTIDVHDRRCLLAIRSKEAIQLTPIGCIAEQCWRAIPSHFPNATLDELVIMPDHMHGIVWLDGNAESRRAHSTGDRAHHYPDGPESCPECSSEPCRKGVQLNALPILPPDSTASHSATLLHAGSVPHSPTLQHRCTAQQCDTSAHPTQSDVRPASSTALPVGHVQPPQHDESTAIPTDPSAMYADTIQPDGADSSPTPTTSATLSSSILNRAVSALPQHNDVSIARARHAYFSEISPPENSLGVIIRTYKAAVKKWCNQNGYPHLKWHTNYFERIIRSDRQLKNTSRYISNNPAALASKHGDSEQ